MFLFCIISFLWGFSIYGFFFSFFLNRIDHYVKQRDIQTVAMLCCAFGCKGDSQDLFRRKSRSENGSVSIILHQLVNLDWFRFSFWVGYWIGHLLVSASLFNRFLCALLLLIFDFLYAAWNFGCCWIWWKKKMLSSATSVGSWRYITLPI